MNFGGHNSICNNHQKLGNSRDGRFKGGFQNPAFTEIENSVYYTFAQEKERRKADG